jgi:hypothetical protein
MLYLHAPEDDVVAFMRRETPFSELVWRGSVAVDAFNLMGAYLAALPLLQRLKRDPTAPPSWLSTREYILDRLQRLAPLFYAFTLLCLLLNAVVAPIMNATNAWRNFVFVANFFPFETTFMQHTWSLSLEMQLHLALPALVYALHARAAQPARAFRLVATALVACAVRASCCALRQRESSLTRAALRAACYDCVVRRRARTVADGARVPAADQRARLGAPQLRAGRVALLSPRLSARLDALRTLLCWARAGVCARPPASWRARRRARAVALVFDAARGGRVGAVGAEPRA